MSVAGGWYPSPWKGPEYPPPRKDMGPEIPHVCILSIAMDPVKRYETPSNCLTVFNVYSKTTLGPAYNEHSAITDFFV